MATKKQHTPKLLIALRLLLAIAAVLFSIWIWLFITEPTRFSVQRVMVESSFKHISPAELEQLILPWVTGNFFTIKTHQLEKRLMQLQWIKQVDISRLWPAAIKIQLTEQQAKAYWNKAALVNAEGDIFKPRELGVMMLPHLIGPINQSTTVWQQYRFIKQQLQPLKLHISELKLNAREAWQIRLKNGMQLLLGRQDIANRVQRFVEFYPRLFTNRGTRGVTVDLRYPNGFAINWGGKSTSQRPIAKSK